MKNNNKIKTQMEMFKLMNYSFYWLHAMVKAGMLTESEAGYISHISEGNIQC